MNDTNHLQNNQQQTKFYKSYIKIKLNIRLFYVLKIKLYI